MTLWTMDDNIALNNCGSGREWQTEEIQSLLPAPWWWAHALSCIPLAACHQVISWMAVTSHFLESNQLIVFPFCYGHKACNNEKLGSSCTTVLSLIWTTLQPPNEESSILPASLHTGCKYLEICFIWVRCHGGCDMHTIASGSLLPILHNSLWHLIPPSNIWKLKIGNGICRAVIWCVPGFKKDLKLKAWESKKAYQYHHGYVTLNKPLVMIHSWLLAKWNGIFLLFIVLSCKTYKTLRKKNLQKGSVTLPTTPSQTAGPGSVGAFPKVYLQASEDQNMKSWWASYVIPAGNRAAEWSHFLEVTLILAKLPVLQRF